MSKSERRKKKKKDEIKADFGDGDGEEKKEEAKEDSATRRKKARAKRQKDTLSVVGLDGLESDGGGASGGKRKSRRRKKVVRKSRHSKKVSTMTLKDTADKAIKISRKGASREQRKNATPVQYRVVRYFDLTPEQQRKIQVVGIVDALSKDVMKFGELEYNEEKAPDMLKVSIKASIALPRRVGTWRNVCYLLIARMGGDIVDKED